MPHDEYTGENPPLTKGEKEYYKRRRKTKYSTKSMAAAAAKRREENPPIQWSDKIKKKDTTVDDVGRAVVADAAMSKLRRPFKYGDGPGQKTQADWQEEYKDKVRGDYVREGSDKNRKWTEEIGGRGARQTQHIDAIREAHRRAAKRGQTISPETTAQRMHDAEENARENFNREYEARQRTKARIKSGVHSDPAKRAVHSSATPEQIGTEEKLIRENKAFVSLRPGENEGENAKIVTESDSEAPEKRQIMRRRAEILARKKKVVRSGMYQDDDFVRKAKKED